MSDSSLTSPPLCESYTLRGALLLVKDGGVRNGALEFYMTWTLLKGFL